MHIGLRAHVFVMCQYFQAVLIVDRDHRFGKAAFFPSDARAALAFHRQQVGIIAAEPVFGGNDIGRNALGDEIGIHRQGWINGNRRPIAAHDNPAHHLHPARDISVTRPTAHLVGGDIHRLHAGRTKAVDRKAGDRFVQIRRQHGRASQTPALFAHLGNIAPDHVFHRMAFQPVARLHSVQHLGGKRNRRQLVQAAIAAALAAR